MRKEPDVNRLLLAGALTLLIVTPALTACARDVPSTAPSIVGEVESLERASSDGTTLTMLVRDRLEERGFPSGGEYDAASVRVTRDTRVFTGSARDPRTGTAEDIRGGDRVAVWFTGPVAESYPVQATAGTVLVLGGRPAP
ncbi:MAG: DUF3221 domain-containing protein [Coriobacteriia bacterium]|nr:DUF3221 domain-containing protein [Coriobacteriia bacterium]